MVENEQHTSVHPSRPTPRPAPEPCEAATGTNGAAGRRAARRAPLAPHGFGTPVTVECIGEFSPYQWPPGETIEPPPLLEKHIGDLQALGLTPNHFAAFKVFVGHPFDYCVRFPDERRGWRTAKPKTLLTNSALLAHLRGERWIATGVRWNPSAGRRGRMQTRFFVIDLDAGNDLADRYQRTEEALGTPSLVFRSSDSGGLHLWYFLAAPVDLYRLKDSKGTGGAVIRLLASRGLFETKGKVEFYPTGKLRRRRRGNRLRLPFGAGSRLLDPRDCLTPVTGGMPLDDLRYIARALEQGDVPVHDFELLCNRARDVHVRRSRKAPQMPRARALSTEVRPGAHCLLKEGLTGPGELNKSLTRIAFHYRAKGISEEDCARAVIKWLEARHNGQSRTYNADPSAARTEARLVVAGIFSRYGTGLGRREPLPPLARGEVSRILARTKGELYHSDPESGEVMMELKRFRLQEFLFESARLHKQFVLRAGEQAYAETARRHPGLHPTGREFARAALSLLRPTWPNPARPEFIVPFPYDLRRRMKGMSGSAHTPYWHAAQATGLYERMREADYLAGECELYRVQLDFVSGDDGAALHDSLAPALAALLTDAEVDALYSDHYARVIRRARDAGTSPMAAPPRGDFERFVIGQLVLASSSMRRAA